MNQTYNYVRLLLLLLVSWGLHNACHAQVTLGEKLAPHKFSVLELSARTTNGGLRLPHLTTAQRDDLNDPATPQTIIGEEQQANPGAGIAPGLALGLTIYNTDTNCIEFWNGKKWVSMCDDVCTDPATPLISSSSTTAGELCNGVATLTATSAGAKTYQWYKDGAIVAGATAITYTATATGTYTVKAMSGICESAVSAGFAITTDNVTPVLAWSGTPVSDAVAGQIYTYTATLTSMSAGLTYTWAATNGTVVSGQGTASAVISFTSAGTATVSCTATNTCGSTSNTLSQTVAVCAVPATPTISSSSGNMLCNGSTTLTASSAGATSYQWYKDGAIVAGATAGTYTATSVGTYTVKAVTSVCESAVSTGFAITSNNVTPVLAWSGTPVASAVAGQNYTYTATLTSASAGLTYTWTATNGTIVSGQGTASTVISFTSAGTATVSCTATNTCGSTSNALSQTVAVCTAPATPVISSSSGNMLCNGSTTLTASVVATSYQWYRGGAIISGATARNYTATSTGTYTVKAVTSVCESAVSTGFAITSNNVTPVLVWNGTPPTSVVPGQNNTYSVTVTSASAGLTYTWAVTNGAIVSGQGTTSAVIRFTSGGTGTVSCKTTNSCGSTSNILSLSIAVCTVPPTPVISSSSGNQIYGTTTLTTTSAGATSYQWYRAGAIISGATAGSYTTNVAGSYTVIARSGLCQSTASVAYTLTVGKCGAYVAAGVWKEFMCHNLGANTSLDPFDLTSAGAMAGGLNGNYYQWGRSAFVATATTPPAAIAGWNTTYPPDNALMDFIKTANDPCPSGFRVPTVVQWGGVVNEALNPQTPLGSWTNSTTNYSSGRRFGTGLLLPAGGERAPGNGMLLDRGIYGYYWTSTMSTPGGQYAISVFVSVGSAYTVYGGNSFSRSGYSMRCVAE